MEVNPRDKKMYKRGPGAYAGGSICIGGEGGLQRRFIDSNGV